MSSTDAVDPDHMDRIVATKWMNADALDGSMLKAQLRSKIGAVGSEWQDFEDILTGDFFGAMQSESTGPVSSVRRRGDSFAPVSPTAGTDSLAPARRRCSPGSAATPATAGLPVNRSGSHFGRDVIVVEGAAEEGFLGDGHQPGRA